jgi:enoyl-CoA hydratase/carnithine racemase
MALLYEKEGKIVTITLNRPEAHNSFDNDQTDEFSKACIKFRDDPDAWVAIITGAGDKAFSAGADLKKMVSTDGPAGKFEKPPHIARGLSITKPIIAAINGVAFGAGLEVALACDIRIASEQALLGTPEVKWSVIPGWGGTQRLPRMIPRAKAAELLMMGNNIDAKEAYRLGLVNAIVPPAEVMPTAKKWAAKIAENGPLAVRAVKESMMLGTDTTLEKGLDIEFGLLARVFKSEDAIEGPNAFIEKRKPKYKGK